MLKLDVCIEVLEQDLRRDKPLARKRRIGDQKKRRNEREADSPVHAASTTTYGPHAAGGSVAPGPSERCIITESVQRPNLKPIEGR